MTDVSKNRNNEYVKDKEPEFSIKRKSIDAGTIKGSHNVQTDTVVKQRHHQENI